jgi:hypothetical protein
VDDLVAIDSPRELLAELGRRGAVVSGGPDEVTIARTPRDPVLEDACRRWKWLLVWGVHGSEHGFRWYACSVCGEIRMTNAAGGRCRMTPGCPGKEILDPGPVFVPTLMSGRVAS